jgi:hypothetical protein
MAELRPWLVSLLALALVALMGVGFWVLQPGSGPIVVDSYRVADDDTLVISVMEGSASEARVTEVTETADSVTIVVREVSLVFGPTAGTTSPTELIVDLEVPLGDRAVFDPHHAVPLAD